MSEPPIHATASAAAAAASDSAGFTELWTTAASKLGPTTARGEKQGSPVMPGTAAFAAAKGLQSPRQRGVRLLGLNNGDSPGEVEVSQDIVWDSTSPTHASAGTRQRNNRVVAISDIANRIAPKDVKPSKAESHLLQWIGDGAIPCTPDVPRPRPRKKLSRQSSVDDLLKLARQFDRNMQQDGSTSGQLVSARNNAGEPAPETKAPETSRLGNARDPRCPSSSSEQVEAELQALFDSSTQMLSGRFSECSASSACSQETRGQPAKRQQSALKSEGKAPFVPTVDKRDNFEDDWENDDFLDDSLVLALTQDPHLQADARAPSNLDAKTNTTPVAPLCEPTAITDSQSSKAKPGHSALQELCPKLKTTNRSTFKLAPNPHFQARVAKEASKSGGFTAVQDKSRSSTQKSATAKTCSVPRPDRVISDISDSMWDDGDDDALFYQVCDNMEKTSDTAPPQTTSSKCQELRATAADRQRKTTEPRTIQAAVGSSVQSPRAFLRSNSLPGTSCATANDRGRNVPTKGASGASRMSQSFPGSRTSVGATSENSSGKFQPANAKLMAGASQSARSHHAAFKRHVSDPAAINGKVFVTSQSQAKCSAAEIERKKQEALARRRLRMQNASNPKAAPS